MYICRYTPGLSPFGFSRADFSLIDFVFAARPGLTHVTEIGTGGGLVSLLCVWMYVCIYIYIDR